MPTRHPEIITKNRLIQPRKIPEELRVAYEYLNTSIYPALGLHTAVEFIDSGWFQFFERFTDFRNFYSRPLFSPPRSSVTNGDPQISLLESKDMMIWELTFEKIPIHKSEEKLARILQKFFQKGGSLGAGCIQKVRQSGPQLVFEIRRENLGSFTTRWNQLIKAGQAFLRRGEKGR